MQKMDCQAIGYGYIIIPKALLKEQLIDCSPHEGEIEAFLKLLIKVNYSETKLTDHQRRTIVCKRGESLHSYRSWSAIFHWPTSRTYRFIQQLKTNGIIEIIPHNDTTALHIRVVDYENWTNISTLLGEKTHKKPATKSSASSGTTTTTSCSSPKRTSPRHSVSGKS